MRVITLTRRFSLFSAALVLLAGLTIGGLIRQHEVEQLEALVEDSNVVMSKFFISLLSAEIHDLVDNPVQSPKTPKIQALIKQISKLLLDSKIVKIKLYNRQGKVVFATDPEQFGQDKSSHNSFNNAINGQTYSELSHRAQFSTQEGSQQEVDLIASYIPIWQGDQVYAVIELYQNVTPILQRSKQAHWRAMAIVLGVLAALLILQTLAVNYAERKIRRQEKSLEQANRDLDRRITASSQALHESEAQVSDLLTEQQLIFNNARVGILLLKDRKILKSNQRMAEMFGYASPAEYEGKSTAIFYRNEDEFLQIGKLAYTKLSEEGQADLETPMRRKDGSDFWVSQSGQSLNLSDALNSQSIWVYTDISERKQNEMESGIAAVAFESQEGMIVTDADCKILRINKAFSATSGYEAEEIIGKTPSLLRSGYHDDDFYAAMWQSIKETGYWQGEIWDRHKSGTIYPKWLTISAVFDQAGKVTHYVGTHIDISERKKAEERITHLAFYDQLTQLPNRALLTDRLKQAMIASDRHGGHGAALLLDLDHFKTLNDTLGHDRGDQLLKQVAEILSANVRQVDTVARLGGDEFFILLLNLDHDQLIAANTVEIIGKKLLTALKQDFDLAGATFHSSASIGATLFSGEKTATEALLKQAELAMYRSKTTGRNTFTFFDPTMEAYILNRAKIEADLRLAIQHQQFVLHYQPQVESNSQRIIGAEALIRWQHPQRGMVGPNDFITSAEENGLILPIGQWVLASACQQLALWATQPLFEHLSIAVNVSVQQFKLSDFVEQVIRNLEATGANPRRLKLELTESLFAENIEDIIQKMSALKSIGVGFALDDFGTGYSSLAYLSRLPLDQLKIDRSFVKDIETSENNIVICAATIKLAHSLELQVIAEGVETEAQRYFLTTVHHCDFLQGYLISKPLALADFAALVHQTADLETV